METEGGRTDHSVEDSLFERGYEFEFCQAVRLLLRMYPDREPVGHSVSPAREVVRFRSRQSLAFPASTVHQLERPENGSAPAMEVAFLGLTGPQGTLPLSYTEHIIEWKAKQDTAPAAFFDIFNHRLIGLFYRAWEKHHFAIAYERQKTSPATARQESLTTYLFDLIGMGTKGLQNRLHIQDEVLLLYAGLIAQRPHSASALAGILRDYFRVDVEIEQFHGKWFSLSEDVLSYLAPEGPHNELGFGAVAGDALWNAQARFRVCVGPLSYVRFQAFLPGGRALAVLTELVQYFIGPALEFDIQLVLMAREVPPCLATDEGERAPMLGLSSWLDRESITYNAREVILEGTRKAA
jgi:type VI secretion system protein ImpH